MTEEKETTVLIVDDDEEVTDIFRTWLGDEYEVSITHGGEEALQTLSEKGIDIVLLDRLMPGMSGEEVLKEIREEGYDCMVAMVTAVEPDFEIIRMGFDEYVRKPSSEKVLRQTVQSLVERKQQSEKRQEYASVCIKKATLEAEKDKDKLRSSNEYEELLSRIESIEQEIDEEVSAKEFLSSLRGLDGG